MFLHSALLIAKCKFLILLLDGVDFCPQHERIAQSLGKTMGNCLQTIREAEHFMLWKSLYRLFPRPEQALDNGTVFTIGLLHKGKNMVRIHLFRISSINASDKRVDEVLQNFL